MTNSSILNWMKARVRGSNEFRSERRRHSKRPQPPIPISKDDGFLHLPASNDCLSKSPTHIYEEIHYRRDYQRTEQNSNSHRASVDIDNLMFDEAKTFGRFLIVPMKNNATDISEKPSVDLDSSEYCGRRRYSCSSRPCATPTCRQRLRNGAVYSCDSKSSPTDDSGFYSPPELRRGVSADNAPSESYLQMLSSLNRPSPCETIPTEIAPSPNHHDRLRASHSNGYKLPSLNETTQPFSCNGSYYARSSSISSPTITASKTSTVNSSSPHQPTKPPRRSLESPIYPSTPSTGRSSSQASSPNYDLLNRCSPIDGYRRDSTGSYKEKATTSSSSSSSIPSFRSDDTKEDEGFLTDAEAKSLSLAERMSCRATAWPRRNLNSCLGVDGCFDGTIPSSDAESSFYVI